MSDVTVESLLEHADWIDGCGHGLGPGEALRAEAARLEAESARDGEAEKLAEDLAFAYCLGFGHDADEFKWNPGGRGHDAWLAVARQVLVLAADGRLLPEGGTVEAAQNCEEMCEDNHDGMVCTRLAGHPGRHVAHNEQDQPLHAWPATPPAVSVPDSGPWDDLRKVPDSVNRVVDKEGAIYRRYKPGPRGWEVHASGTLWSRGMDEDLTDFAPFTVPADIQEPCPDSGSDGTPEKPWPAWQDVPEGVKYTGTCDPFGGGSGPWVNREGVRYMAGSWSESHLNDVRMAGRAPFVRVDGDKA